MELQCFSGEPRWVGAEEEADGGWELCTGRE